VPPCTFATVYLSQDLKSASVFCHVKLYTISFLLNIVMTVTWYRGKWNC